MAVGLFCLDLAVFAIVLGVVVFECCWFCRCFGHGVSERIHTVSKEWNSHGAQLTHPIRFQSIRKILMLLGGSGVPLNALALWGPTGFNIPLRRSVDVYSTAPRKVLRTLPTNSQKDLRIHPEKGLGLSPAIYFWFPASLFGRLSWK